MSKVEGIELGLFGRVVIDNINETLGMAEDMCKELWQDNHEDCPLRENSPVGEFLRCGYPERINSTRENNCTYESCPLIHK